MVDLVKAKNNVSIISSLSSERFTRTVRGIGYSEIFSNLKYHSFWIADNQSARTSKGRTNWSAGDIILVKSYMYLWLKPNAGNPLDQRVDVKTSIRLVGQSQTDSEILSKTKVEFFDQNASCAIVPMDVLYCKILGPNSYAVLRNDGNITLEEAYDEVSTYLLEVSANAINDGSPSHKAYRFYFDNTYVGTEQEDGSVIYLA